MIALPDFVDADVDGLRHGGHVVFDRHVQGCGRSRVDPVRELHPHVEIDHVFHALVGVLDRAQQLDLVAHAGAGVAGHGWVAAVEGDAQHVIRTGAGGEHGAIGAEAPGDGGFAQVGGQAVGLQTHGQRRGAVADNVQGSRGAGAIGGVLRAVVVWNAVGQAFFGYAG